MRPTDVTGKDILDFEFECDYASFASGKFSKRLRMTAKSGEIRYVVMKNGKTVLFTASAMLAADAYNNITE